MSELTDASLVGAALAGDTESFCALVRRYQDHVYAVALGILAAYRDTGDPLVGQALQNGLADPKHKVRHAAAGILGVRCPGCGKTW